MEPKQIRNYTILEGGVGGGGQEILIGQTEIILTWVIIRNTSINLVKSISHDEIPLISHYLWLEITLVPAYHSWILICHQHQKSVSEGGGLHIKRPESVWSSSPAPPSTTSIKTSSKTVPAAYGGDAGCTGPPVVLVLVVSSSQWGVGQIGPVLLWQQSWQCVGNKVFCRIIGENLFISHVTRQ